MLDKIWRLTNEIRIDKAIDKEDIMRIKRGYNQLRAEYWNGLKKRRRGNGAILLMEAGGGGCNGQGS